MTLAFGMLLQILAVAVVAAVFRRSALRRPGLYFVAAVFIFDGGAEMLHRMVGGALPARVGGVEAYVGRWNVIVGASALAFAVAYCATSGRSTAAAPDEAARQHVLRVLDWRIVGALTVPLVLIAGSGGYAYSATANAAVAAQAQSGIVGQFIVLGITLTGVCFIAAHPRWFPLAYLVQLAAIGVVGQRLDVLAVAVGTLVGLALLGHRPGVRPAVVAVLIALALSVAIDSARAHYGRQAYQAAGSIPARLSIIIKGAEKALTGAPAVHPTDTQPLSQRLDGNTFPAAVLKSLDHDYRPVGTRTALDDLELAVPSFLNPGKLSSDPARRSEKLYQNGHFSLGYVSDFLPTQLGSAVAYFGPGWLAVLAALLGIGYGLVERFARTRLTPGRFLALLGLTLCALSYEQSNEVYPLTARGVLVVWFGLTVLAVLRPRFGLLRRPSSASRARRREPEPASP